VDKSKEELYGPRPEEPDFKGIIRDVIHEFVDVQRAKAEPAYKTELAEERKRREQLESRLNELIEENQRSRQRAEEAERGAAIRGELQRLGVAKADLAFRAVKDDIARSEDGQLVARTGRGEVPMRDYLAQFVTENPELLPARIVGGSGAAPNTRSGQTTGGGVDLEKIRPGMDREEMERVRQEIARVAAQQSRGV
jgi:uncharacterized protein YhaN